MSKYQPYPEYIDIKNNFIDTLPLGWVLSKLKYEIDYVEGPGILATDFHDIGVPLLRIQNIKGRFTTGDIKTYLDPRKVKDKWEHFKVLSGDLLISGSASTDLIAEVTEPYEGAVPYTGLIRLRAKKERTDKHYIRYFVQSELFKNQIDNLKTGSTIQHFGPIHLQQIVYPSSSIEQQQQIAAFLDHETAKIDTLIEKQQHLIELLKEKRQAVISHAVTKGLNPDAPMKDSGVEWLGEVPEHWGVVKLSYKLKLLSGDGITSLEIEPEGEFPVFGGNGLRGYCSKYNCEGDYVLIGRQGALCGNINIATGQFFASEHAVVVYPHEQFDITFLSEFLRFMNLGQYSVSAAQPGISVERVNNLKIAVPPLNEQKEIGRYIDKYSKEYDALSKLAQKQVDLLKERRTALISAAVTGKIDVRHWVAPTTSSDANEAQQEVTA